MKKMKKAGVLVSAIATTAVCASMIAGSTFALFTSEDQVDITVKAGSVEVSSSIENAQITHATSIEKNGEDYAVSYTDAVAEKVTVSGNELALTNVIPGDVMEFDIVLSNDGTVDANYQYSLKCTEGLKLISALDVEIVNGETSVYSGSALKSYQSKWGELNVKAENAYHVTLTLPAGAGNEYKGLTSKLVVGTYAVQYNAVVDKTAEAVVETVPEEATVVDVKSVKDFETALSTDSSYVLLNEDITVNDGDMDNIKHVANSNGSIQRAVVLQTSDVSIDLNGHTMNTDVAYRLMNGANVTLSNGTWKVNQEDYEEVKGNFLGECAFTVFDSGNAGDNTKLTLNNVDIVDGSYGIGVKCSSNAPEGAEPLITVNGGSITTTHPYACSLGTTALMKNGEVLYKGGKVVMNGTTINSAGAGIMLTVPVQLELNNCTINSRMQCLVIRAGEVTLNGCTLNNNIYDKAEYESAVDGLSYSTGYMSKKYINNTIEDKTEWGSSNNTDLAAIVMGNRLANNKTTYDFDCKVTVIDTVINQKNGINSDENALVYIHGDAREHKAEFYYSGVGYKGENLKTAGTVANILVNGEQQG